METKLDFNNLIELIEFNDAKEKAEEKMNLILIEIQKQEISILRIPISPEITFAYFRNLAQKEMIDFDYLENMKEDCQAFNLTEIEISITTKIGEINESYFQFASFKFIPQVKFISSEHTAGFNFNMLTFSSDDKEKVINFNHLREMQNQ